MRAVWSKSPEPKSPTDEMVHRVRPAALDEYVESGDRPHHRIFQAELIPKILADAPALDVGDQKENEDDGGDGARESSEREQRPAD